MEILLLKVTERVNLTEDLFSLRMKLMGSLEEEFNIQQKIMKEVQEPLISLIFWMKKKIK